MKITFFNYRILALAVVLTWTTALSSEASSLIESAKEKRELVGPVRQTITKDPYATTTETYDRSGNLIEEVVDFKYDKDERHSHYVFTYDEREVPKEIFRYEDGGRLVPQERFSISFNEQGKPVAMVATRDDGSYVHSAFGIYDNRGNLADKIFFGGGFIEKDLFDIQGKMIYSIRFRGNTFLFESVNHYDLKGDLVESLYYNADGSLSRKDQYKYDQARRQIEQHIDIFDHPVKQRKSLMRSKFDNYGNWIRQTVERWTDENGTVESKTEITRERTISYH